MPPVIVVSLFYVIAVPLVWTIVFWRKRKEGPANLHVFLLALFIFYISLSNFFNITEVLPVSMAIRVFYPLVMVSVPVLYIFFIYYLVSGKNQLPHWYLLFYILPVAQFIFSGYAFYIHVPSEILKPWFYNIVFMQPNGLPDSLKPAFMANKVTIFMFLAGLLTMVIASIFLIPAVIKNVEQEFSATRERLIMRFLILISITLVICVSTIIEFNKGKDFHDKWNFLGINLFWGTGWMLCGILIHKELAYKNRVITLSEPEEKNSSPLLEQLQHYFETKKPYLIPELKIFDVARALGTNRTYISDLLNNEMDTNFNNFVNRYRVMEAKRLLNNGVNPSNTREIATRCGFNSYPTFFRAIKEISGMSPSDFLKSNNT